MDASGREAPHGAWPLVAAYFWDPGLPRPDAGTSLTQGPKSFLASRVLQYVGGFDEPRGALGGVRGIVGEVGPTDADQAGERRGPVECGREVASDDATDECVDHFCHLGRTGWFLDTGDDFVDGRELFAGRELARGEVGLLAYPRAQRVQPPQAAGERVDGGAGPQLRDCIEAFLVGEVEDPVYELLVAGVARSADEQRRDPRSRFDAVGRVGIARLRFEKLGAG